MERFETQEAQGQAWSGGAAAAAVETEAPPNQQPELAVDNVLYSIRLPTPATTQCGRCGTPFEAAGPTGYADEEPICDVCFLQAERGLGMLLALVSVVRLFAVSEYHSSDEYWIALAEVGAFGRLFERIAKQSGPLRIFRLPSKQS
jgi:hypothetical protein